MQRIYHRVVVVGQFLAAVLVDMHAKKNEHNGTKYKMSKKTSFASKEREKLIFSCFLGGWSMHLARLVS